jgi:hypothetical protein
LIHIKDNIPLDSIECLSSAFTRTAHYHGKSAMSEKIARIEELLGETITEVTLYRTPSGALFKTKEEAITSIIANACPDGDTKECREYRERGLRCQDCKIGTFLRNDS